MKNGLEGDKLKLTIIICHLITLTFNGQKESVVKRQHISVQRANEVWHN